MSVGCQLPNVRIKCHRFSSSRTRVSPVFACLKSSELALPLEAKVDALLDSVKWDDKGLAVAIAQNVDTGAVLMQGFVNREALLKTISSRKATFYSKSRSTLWTKGETSMNFINICDVFIDCDRNSILYLGKPDGPTCHTGSETCYYTSVNEVLSDSQVDGEEKIASTTLHSLESTISKRKEELSGNTSKPSWIKHLFPDTQLLRSKISPSLYEIIIDEESSELAPPPPVARPPPPPVDRTVQFNILKSVGVATVGLGALAGLVVCLYNTPKESYENVKESLKKATEILKEGAYLLRSASEVYETVGRGVLSVFD